MLKLRFDRYISVEKIQVLSKLSVSANFHGLLGPEGISKLQKLVTMLSNKISIDITRAYN